MALRVSCSVGLSTEVRRPSYGNSGLSISLEVVAERCLLVFNVVSC